MPKKKATRMFKLYNHSIEIDKEIKPIRVCNRRATIIGEILYSYDTKVAIIDWESKTIFVKERAFFYSNTTTKQIRTVTQKYKLTMFGGRPNRTIHKHELTHGGRL